MKTFILAYVIRFNRSDGSTSDKDYYDVFPEYDRDGRSPGEQADNRLKEIENSYDGDASIHSWNIAEITKTSEWYPIENNDSEISFLETYYEIVNWISTERNKTELTGIVAKIQEEQGSTGFYTLAKQWTDEFQEKYKDESWDGQFFDLVEEFCNLKNKL